LSFYVYYRLLICSFSNIYFDIVEILNVIFIFSIIVSSAFAISQIDMKKIIAYSSISHMSYGMIGLFSGNIIAILGSIFLMFGHALVSSALFMSIGIIYDRYKSRIIFYYGGLALLMPLMMTIFFVLVLSNFGMPGTVNFVGEFIIFLGCFKVNNIVMFFSTFGMFLTMLYSLFMYNRISTGPFKLKFIYYFCDINRREFNLIIIFIFLSIFFGVFPNLMFDYLLFN
jgi:NADH-quinone oxidoreductase subunit M